MAKLKKNYVQHIDKCNQSGEEKKNPPPCFKELGDILSYKANVNPAFTLCSSGEREDRKELEAKLTKQHEEKMALLDRLVNAHENK